MTFTDILRQLHIEYREAGQHHHVGNNWIGLDCPSCSRNSHRFRLGYNLSTGHMSCWTCGHKNPLSVLMDLTGQSFSSLKPLLEGVSTQKWTEVPRKDLKLPVGLSGLQQQHIRYLQDRGFDAVKLSTIWGVGGLGIVPKMSWRIFIPIHYQGRVVSWTTRTIGKSDPRYINARPEQESMNAKHLLFGEDFVRHSLLVCEGPFDAMRIGPGAVATMGIAFSRQQLIRMSKYPVRVICFDSERDAQRRAKQICSQLEVFPGSTYRVELSAKDPGSASEKEIQQLRKEFLE